MTPLEERHISNLFIIMISQLVDYTGLCMKPEICHYHDMKTKQISEIEILNALCVFCLRVFIFNFDSSRK